MRKHRARSRECSQSNVFVVRAGRRDAALEPVAGRGDPGSSSTWTGLRDTVCEATLVTRTCARRRDVPHQHAAEIVPSCGSTTRHRRRRPGHVTRRLHDEFRRRADALSRARRRQPEPWLTGAGRPRARGRRRDPRSPVLPILTAAQSRRSATVLFGVGLDGSQAQTGGGRRTGCRSGHARQTLFARTNGSGNAAAARIGATGVGRHNLRRCGAS